MLTLFTSVWVLVFGGRDFVAPSSRSQVGGSSSAGGPPFPASFLVTNLGAPSFSPASGERVGTLLARTTTAPCLPFRELRVTFVLSFALFSRAYSVRKNKLRRPGPASGAVPCRLDGSATVFENLKKAGWSLRGVITALIYLTDHFWSVSDIYAAITHLPVIACSNRFGIYTLAAFRQAVLK